MLTNNLDHYKDAEHIYVLNKTKTDFLFRVRVDDDIALISVPRTFIPIDLKMWAPTKYIINSIDLRNALRLEALELIDERDAVKILESRDGAREWERLRRKFNFAENLNYSTPGDGDALEAAAVGEIDEANKKVMEALVDTSLDCDDKLAIIISLDREAPLDKATLDYIKSSCPATCDEILAFVEQRLENYKNEGLRRLMQKS